MREKIAAGVAQVKQNQALATVWNKLAPVRENPFPMQVLLTILYRLALDLVYILLISPTNSYAGFTTTALPLRYLLSVLPVVAFAPLVANLLNDESPSSILLSFINYMYFIPLTSYYGCHGSDILFFGIAILYWGIMIFLQQRIPKLRLRPLSGKNIHICIVAATVGSIGFVLTISGIYTDFRITLNFIDVYGIRAEAATYQMPVVASYLLGMMPIILAVLLAYWARCRKRLVVGILAITFLFLFSIGGHKSTFFFLFLVLASMILYREWMFRWMPGLLLLISAVPFMESMLGGVWICSLFFRRMMFVPVQLSEKYAVFFSEHPLNLFQDGIMGKFSFDGIYATTIPRIIGEFVGEYQMNGNNGLLGDMYANLPITLGLLLMPLILVVCFRIFDLLAGKIDQKILMPFCVYFAIVFIDSSWSTTLLTHGFLVACVLLYFFPKEGTS